MNTANVGPQREDCHDIVIGQCVEGSIQCSKHAGTAIRREDGGYYTIRINMFPNITYFLSKNHGDNPNYTIFSRLNRYEDGVRLQNPVGSARLTEELKTHLELKFNLLERKMFMSLFPAN